MTSTARRFFVAASLLGFLGIAGGAFGAHTLRDRLAAELLSVFETGIRYQMYHVFALIGAGWAVQKYEFRQFRYAGWSFLAGVALFSGSLYIMALTGIRWIGIVTPLGGLAFLAGWLFMTAGFWRIR